MNKMKKVPENIITGKDLDYLSDVFMWNYDAWKSCNFYSGYIEDEKLLDIYDESLELFDENLNEVLNILDNPGGDSND